MTDGAERRSTHRRADRWLPLVLFVGALSYLLPLRAHGLSLNDDGWWLQPVLRMQEGEVLYRDIWVFYAPLFYHVIEGVFWVTGPSLLVGRTVMVLLIAASAALSYRVARRFVPPAWAWIPVAVYVTAPGPWHKAYYATCTAAVLLCLARVLEHASGARLFVLGGVVGVTLATRQDLGLVGFGVAFAGAVVPPLAAPRAARPLAAAARRAGLVAAGIAIVLAPLVAYYAAVGALGALYEATVGHAFGQAGGHEHAIARILAPATFAQAPEGRAVGFLMLSPLAVYGVLGPLAAWRLTRRPGDPANLLLAALVLFGIAGLPQSWYPMLLLRFLQSALPFYLATAVALYELRRRLEPRVPGVRYAALAILASAALAHLAVVIAGVPTDQPLYRGSFLSRAYRTPVPVLGDTLYERWEAVEEIRLVRRFFAEHAAPGEPTLGLPSLSLYNPILERPNPTRFVAEHPLGHFVMSAERKRAEAGRLLASKARFVLVPQRWYTAGGGDADPLLGLLRTRFHPVRAYGALLILARGADPKLGGLIRRAVARGAAPENLDAWRTLAVLQPDEPLVWRMLGAHQRAAGDLAGAIASLQRAAALDPADPAPLEDVAELRLARGERAAARAALARARAVRESPRAHALAALAER